MLQSPRKEVIVLAYINPNEILNIMRKSESLSEDQMREIASVLSDFLNSPHFRDYVKAVVEEM